MYTHTYVCLLRTEEGEQAAARRARRVAEGQGEDGPGSVGDSGATPIVVWRWWWWRWSDGVWSGQEEEEEAAARTRRRKSERWRRRSREGES